MDRYGTKAILSYYAAIPGMLALLKKEKELIEAEYYGIRGLAGDSEVRGSSPGNPTERAAIRAAKDGARERLDEISEKTRVLVADAAAIRGCLDDLAGEYKQLVISRTLHGDTWAKISACSGVPESTARHWLRRAEERLGVLFDSLPAVDELRVRASRAR